MKTRSVHFDIIKKQLELEEEKVRKAFCSMYKIYNAANRGELFSNEKDLLDEFMQKIGYIIDEMNQAHLEINNETKRDTEIW